MGESNDEIWALFQGIIKESETDTDTLRRMTLLKSLTGDKVSGRGVIFGADIVHDITAVCIDFFHSLQCVSVQLFDFVQIHCPFLRLKVSNKITEYVVKFMQKKKKTLLCL